MMLIPPILYILKLNTVIQIVIVLISAFINGE